jgi:hypothetical protein
MKCELGVEIFLQLVLYIQEKIQEELTLIDFKSGKKGKKGGCGAI